MTESKYSTAFTWLRKALGSVFAIFVFIVVFFAVWMFYTSNVHDHLLNIGGDSFLWFAFGMTVILVFLMIGTFGGIIAASMIYALFNERPDDTQE